YDEVYRLKNIRFNSPEPTTPETDQFEKQKNYHFDKVDNILKIVESQNEQTTEIVNSIEGNNLKLNQYTRFDEWGLSYDQNGNTTQKGVQQFTYDYKNQLLSAQDLNIDVNYRYDPFGRRVEKTTGSSTTKYFYDFNQVIEERNSSNQVLKQYVYGNGIDEILRVDKYESGNPIPYYYHTNAIGSVTAITGSSGDLVERISYDTFGMPTITDSSGEIISTSTIGNEYLFQGRRYDKTANLYYYRARYYDPIMGRFLQNDPMGYADSMNLYQGFGMNPVNFIDPLGLLTYAWKYHGVYAEDPSLIEDPSLKKESKSLKQFPYGDIKRYLGGIESQAGIVLNLRASDIEFKIVPENDKYYPRFDFKLSTFIFLKENRSKKKHSDHEKEHIVGYKLLFLETLYALKNAENQGFSTPDECKSFARSVLEPIHPLRRKFFPAWWPFRSRLWWLTDIFTRESSHYGVWKKFAKRIDSKKIDRAILDFENEYKRNPKFDISRYKKK
ncbi:MAG: hypothetical protein KAW12_22690, partial [Candidatus Aminicenantes bacterium]|nr:hypothetical protein [Candidatus Aminicenantes bacterium]